MANRRGARDFDSLEAAKRCRRYNEEYDVIIGSIADDRMADAIREFSSNSMTDQALMYCLTYIDYGQQIVLTSQNACEKAKILLERDIFAAEADDIRKYTYLKRKESREIISRAKREFLRKGMYFSEIIEKEKEEEAKVRNVHH